MIMMGFILNRMGVIQNQIYINLGFFDPDGYFFDKSGYDEFGGFYEDGVYVEADFEAEDEYDPTQEHIYEQYEKQIAIEPTLLLIDAAEAGTSFVAVLKNLPYRARENEVIQELKGNNIQYQKMECVRDSENKLVKVKLTTNVKEIAKAIMKLNDSYFLGRKLRIEFLDLADDEFHNLEPIVVKTELIVVPPTENKMETPSIAPPKTEEKKEIPQPTQQPQSLPHAKPQPPEVPIEIPKDLKSVWDMSPEDQIKLIASQPVQSKAPPQKTQTTVKYTDKKKKPAKRGKK